MPKGKRMKSTTFLAAFVAVASIAIPPLVAQSEFIGNFDLSWHTIDGGGQTFSSGGEFDLGGTIGQADAGATMSGGSFELRGGFWGGPTPVDACPADIAPSPNGNGIVDVDDLLAIINDWGRCVGCAADIAPPGGNGMVDVDDLLKVINDWGFCDGV
jgi:hypothetical protein